LLHDTLTKFSPNKMPQVKVNTYRFLVQICSLRTSDELGAPMSEVFVYSLPVDLDIAVVMGQLRK